MVFCTTVHTFAQNDLASREEMIDEQQNINFQTFFFEALQQKAIENYDKAIYALDACYNIDKKNVAVLFELSKNYTFLTKYTEAEYYILKGLELEPNNLFMLKHLMDIKSKQNDFKGAIKIQKRIIKIVPEEESELVLLYIKSGQIQDAIITLKKLDSVGKLPPNLSTLKASLTQEPARETTTAKIVPVQDKLTKLKESYALKNDFNSLKLVLDRELKTKAFLDLQNDSQAGIEMFPAQPYVYYMNGVALNHLRKYQEAITILQEGLEYLVDDAQLQAAFYKQISLSYKGLGKNKEATSFFNKSLETK